MSSDPHSHIHKCKDEGKNFETPQMIKIAKEMTDGIKQWISLSKNSIILDFGTGTGLIGLNLINEVKKVIFEDVSENMLNYLKEKLTNKNIKNYEIFLGEIQNYKTEEKIDLITAGLVIHHIENLQNLFKVFLNLLKPKGYLCLSDMKKNAPMFDLHSPKHKMPHKGFDQEELCNELKKAGFVKTEIKPASNIVYHNKEGKEISSERFIILAQGP